MRGPLGPLVVGGCALLCGGGLALAAERGPAVGLYSGVAASLSRGSAAAAAGLRLALGERLTLGLSAEYNPWLFLTPPYAAPGLFNAYASVSLAWMDFHGLRLRTGLQVGLSVLLFDLVAADAGSAGVFAGVGVLGVVVPLRPGLRLELDPAWLVLPIPQLRGVPLLYEQYRVAIGLCWEP